MVFWGPCTPSLPAVTLKSLNLALGLLLYCPSFCGIYCLPYAEYLWKRTHSFLDCSSFKAVVPCQNKIILRNFSVARNHV